MAAGTLNAGIEAIDYLTLAGRHGFRFRLGKMIGLDRRRRKVLLDAVTDERGSEIIPSGSRFVEGRLARLIYHYLYRSHQRVVLGLVKTLLIAATDRINRRIRPRLKLH